MGVWGQVVEGRYSVYRHKARHAFSSKPVLSFLNAHAACIKMHVKCRHVAPCTSPQREGEQKNNTYTGSHA